MGRAQDLGQIKLDSYPSLDSAPYWLCYIKQDILPY